MSAAPRLGFVGLGDIGMPMALRLLGAGPVVAWNRSPDKLAAFVTAGGEAAVTPAELMERCDLIGLCLTSHDAVEAVAFGADGLFSRPATGKVVADFSTGSPDRAMSFAARATAGGAGWVDAPVSGGVAGAHAGTLIIFAGGTAADVAAVQPLFAPLAARVSHMGSAGAGQTTKLCNQMIVACNVLVMAETLAAARRAGVDAARLPSALKGGFADSTPFQIFGPRMAEHRFTPRLGAIGLMEKDLLMARQMVEQAGAIGPISKLCADLYARVHDTPAMDVEADIASVIGLFEPSAS